jgi:hypothetical protein
MLLDDLQLVDHWRRYLAKPGFYLHHIINAHGEWKRRLVMAPEVQSGPADRPY